MLKEHLLKAKRAYIDFEAHEKNHKQYKTRNKLTIKDS